MNRFFRRRIATVPGFAAAYFAPQVASACSACSGGSTDGSQSAFFFASLFLSFVPLALIGGIAVFLLRRARRFANEDEQRMLRGPGESEGFVMSGRPVPPPSAGRPQAARSAG